MNVNADTSVKDRVQVRVVTGMSIRSLIPTVVVAVTAVLCPTAAKADYTVTVNPTVHYQTMEGWGTSLCWWANVVGGFPEPARSDYITKFFDPVQGLGLNIVRYNIGGGENPLYLAPNKQFLAYRTNMPGFEPSPGVWDWTADANQRYILQQAVTKGANIVQAFSNSPPWWMTISGSVTGNHESAQNNIDPAHYQDFADYLTTVAAHFHKSWGVTFDTLEPLNEPDGYWWRFGGRQEGCFVDPTSGNHILNLVAKSLKAQLLKTQLAASDDNSINDAVLTFSSYDPETLSSLKQIDTHSYNGHQRAELRQLAASTGKDLWMSEYGDNDGTGLTMSKRILLDIKDMGATAWVTWQAVDGRGWGLLDNPETDSTTTAYKINEKYYVLGQYSKFIRPGAVIIDNDDAQSLTAWDNKARKLVIVTTNDSDASVRVSYNLTKFSGVAIATAYQTTASECLAPQDPLSPMNGSFSDELPNHSVTTFVVTGLHAGHQ